MRAYSLTHLSDAALLHGLTTLVARDRATTAELLAHIAEVDERKLYLPAGYPSMHAYCVEALHLSEDSAFKRIRAARAARRFPVLFDAIAAGELNLASVGLLATHLTEANASELIAEATHKRRVELEALLATRFPQPEFLAIGEITPVSEHVTQQAPGPVDAANALPAHTPNFEPDPFRPRVTPVAAERYLLHVPIDRATHEKLKHATELLSHALPSGDVAQVLDRALDTLIAQLERRKCAKTEHPRPRPSRSRDPRHIPAHVRRVVWERDQGRCTFVGDTGHRCNSRTRIEFDHVEPVARGGTAAIHTIRLRCRAHNQFEAERAFGSEFMRHRRIAARERSAAPRGNATNARGEAVRVERSSPDDPIASRRQDVTAALRTLGFRAGEIARGLAYSESIPCPTLETQVIAALRCLAPRSRGARDERPMRRQQQSSPLARPRTAWSVEARDRGIDARG